MPWNLGLLVYNFSIICRGLISISSLRTYRVAVKAKRKPTHWMPISEKTNSKHVKKNCKADALVRLLNLSVNVNLDNNNNKKRFPTYLQNPYFKTIPLSYYFLIFSLQPLSMSSSVNHRKTLIDVFIRIRIFSFRSGQAIVFRETWAFFIFIALNSAGLFSSIRRGDRGGQGEAVPRLVFKKFPPHTPTFFK